MKMYHFQEPWGNGFTTIADNLEEAKKNIVEFMNKEDEDPATTLKWKDCGCYEEIMSAGDKGNRFEVTEYEKGGVVVTEES